MKEKKAHGVQLLIRTVVKDPDGKVVHDSGQRPAKSFVIAFLGLICSFFQHAAVGSKDTSGDVRGPWGGAAGTTCRVDATINQSLWGLVVGTGNTAEDNLDWKLETQLTEGAGAGNITHGAVTVSIPGVVGANVDFEVKRPFTNNTGSVITVKEAGIYSYSSAPYYHCNIRDVLPGPINVPDKCSLTIYYTLRTTV